MEFTFPEGEDDSMQSEPSGRNGGSRKGGGAGARGMGSRGTCKKRGLPQTVSPRQRFDCQKGISSLHFWLFSLESGVSGGSFFGVLESFL